MVVKQNAEQKMNGLIAILEEKLCREYNLDLEQLRKATITIKNGEVTLKGIK